MKSNQKAIPAKKPTFVVQSHPEIEDGWIIEAGFTGYEGGASVSECLQDTEDARAFKETLRAWYRRMEVQSGHVEDSWFEKDRPPLPHFDWNKWELLGVALAVRLSALAGPSWIVGYERAFYGPNPHLCLWRSE